MNTEVGAFTARALRHRALNGHAFLHNFNVLRSLAYFLLLLLLWSLLLHLMPTFVYLICAHTIINFVEMSIGRAYLLRSCQAQFIV